MTLEKEVMIKTLQHQTKGFMFHDQMIYYYKFLHMRNLSKIHEEQAFEEYSNLKEMKEKFLMFFNEIPFYDVEYEKVVPESWKEKTSLEIDEQSLKTLIKTSFEKYLEWEKMTLKLYKENSKILKENSFYQLSSYHEDLIKDVLEEIEKVTDIIIESQSYDYNIDFLKSIR